MYVLKSEILVIVWSVRVLNSAVVVNSKSLHFLTKVWTKKMSRSPDVGNNKKIIIFFPITMKLGQNNYNRRRPFWPSFMNVGANFRYFLFMANFWTSSVFFGSHFIMKKSCFEIFHISDNSDPIKNLQFNEIIVVHTICGHHKGMKCKFIDQIILPVKTLAIKIVVINPIFVIILKKITAQF